MRDDHPLGACHYAVDGVRLHVVVHGHPSARPAVVLLHGLATSSYLWRDVVRDMFEATDHDVLVIAPDLVHLGDSERPYRRVGLAAQARLVDGLLDQLGINRFLVAGHGLGGAVAVHLAALEPVRTAALALLSAPVHEDAWPISAVVPLLVPGLAQLATRGVRSVPWLARRMVAGVLGPDASPTRIDAYARPLLRPDGPRGLVDFVTAVDLRATQSAWDIVRSAPPPTLVLWGTRDHLHAESYGRRVAGELPGAAWVPVMDAGHLLPEERPERVAEELVGFLGDLPDTTATTTEPATGDLPAQ